MEKSTEYIYAIYLCPSSWAQIKENSCIIGYSALTALTRIFSSVKIFQGLFELDMAQYVMKWSLKVIHTNRTKQEVFEVFLYSLFLLRSTMSYGIIQVLAWLMHIILVLWCTLHGGLVKRNCAFWHIGRVPVVPDWNFQLVFTCT